MHTISQPLGDRTSALRLVFWGSRRDGETVSPTQAKQYPTLTIHERDHPHPPPPPRPHPQLVCLHTSTHGPSLLLNTLHPDRTHPPPLGRHIMDDFNSETDSDYTSYWRDWVGTSIHFTCPPLHILPILGLAIPSMGCWVHPVGKRLISAWYVCTICIMGAPANTAQPPMLAQQGLCRRKVMPTHT